MFEENEIPNDPVERFMHYFRRDLIYEARDLITKLESEGSPAAERIKQSEAGQLLLEDFRFVDFCYQEIEDTDSWNQISSSQGITTYSKKVSGKFFARSEMIIETSLFPILALFSEADLLTSWLPMLQTANELASPTNFRKVLYYEFKTPWPCSNRNAILAGVGIPVPDEKSALLMLRSIKSDRFLGVNLPDERPGFVTIDLHLCCINIRQLATEESHVTLIIQSDPKLAMIPNWVINWAMEHIVWYFMDAVRQNALSFIGSVHENRVSERPEFYNQLNERILKYTADDDEDDD